MRQASRAAPCRASAAPWTVSDDAGAEASGGARLSSRWPNSQRLRSPVGPVRHKATWAHLRGQQRALLVQGQQHARLDGGRQEVEQMRILARLGWSGPIGGRKAQGRAAERAREGRCHAVPDACACAAGAESARAANCRLAPASHQRLLGVLAAEHHRQQPRQRDACEVEAG